jgi:hypothetical protein
MTNGYLSSRHTWNKFQFQYFVISIIRIAINFLDNFKILNKSSYAVENKFGLIKSLIGNNLKMPLTHGTSLDKNESVSNLLKYNYCRMTMKTGYTNYIENVEQRDAVNGFFTRKNGLLLRDRVNKSVVYTYLDAETHTRGMNITKSLTMGKKTSPEFFFGMFIDPIKKLFFPCAQIGCFKNTRGSAAQISANHVVKKVL